MCLNIANIIIVYYLSYTALAVTTNTPAQRWSQQQIRMLYKRIVNMIRQLRGFCFLHSRVSGYITTFYIKCPWNVYFGMKLSLEDIKYWYTELASDFESVIIFSVYRACLHALLEGLGLQILCTKIQPCTQLSEHGIIITKCAVPMEMYYVVLNVQRQVRKKFPLYSYH